MAAEFKQGEKIRVKLKYGSYTGVVMQRPELADSDHLTLKLDNGYNIGIRLDSIQETEAIGIVEHMEDFKLEKQEKDKQKPDVSILATGGTIASRVDYLTGGVYSAFTAEEIISAVPEITEIANVSGRQVFNKFSENMTPPDWVTLANEVFKEMKNNVDGVVITHGTDTMGYTAAALSLMLSSNIPVVLTGAQRSSDRGSSDAATNLINSILFASKADYSGVCVLMHEAGGDDSFLVHKGTRVRKLHSSRRDAFKSINSKPLARVRGSKIEFLDSDWKGRGGEINLDSSIEGKVALIKYYPGMSEGVIKNLVDDGYRGIVVEGTGLGHTSESLFKVIESAIESGVVVAMVSQTLYGRINMNVYSTGRMLLKMGVVPCGDMLPETAYVKLCCVLGRTKDVEEARALMLSDLAGELSAVTAP
jgi:glutamyl-tRNA(Gln) amidotransferase subunit D